MHQPVRACTSDTAGRQRRRLGLWAAGLATLLAAALAIVIPAAGLRVVGLGDIALTLGILLGNLLVFGRLRGGERAADLAAYLAFFMLMAPLGGLLSYLAFRAGAPLADARLAGWDAVLGFDWPGWAAFVVERPWLRRPFEFAYRSMMPQLILAIFLLPLCGLARRADELLLVLALGLLATLGCCALLPAEGAGVFFGSTEPARYLEAQRALRDGSLQELSIGRLQGIVTFPSFHTITAIALMNAARGTPLVLLAWVVNALMILSTPTEGWHYLVDVLAGIAVALAAIALARRILRQSG